MSELVKKAEEYAWAMYPSPEYAVHVSVIEELDMDRKAAQTIYLSGAREALQMAADVARGKNRAGAFSTAVEAAILSLLPEE